jgi:hypothetical protein
VAVFYRKIMKEVDMTDTMLSVAISQNSQSELPAGFEMRPATMKDVGGCAVDECLVEPGRGRKSSWTVRRNGNRI